METNREELISSLSHHMNEKLHSGEILDEDSMKRYLLLVTLKKKSEADKNYNL